MKIPNKRRTNRGSFNARQWGLIRNRIVDITKKIRQTSANVKAALKESEELLLH
tara:strand:+ start:186 stop:347 length:162 start_codon:yes stop_codon:yes gene_type:complete